MEVIDPELVGCSAVTAQARLTLSTLPTSDLPDVTQSPKKRKLSSTPPFLVHQSMSMEALMEEADARGLSSQALPRLPRLKADLLTSLGPGSLRIAMSAEWKSVLALRDKVHLEAAARSEKAGCLSEKAVALLEKKELDRKAHESVVELLRIDKERRGTEVVKFREREAVSQKCLHVIDCKAAHGCKLAPVEGMMRKGVKGVVSCAICRDEAMDGYYCDSCDFDVCGMCFQSQTVKREETELEDDVGGGADKAAAAALDERSKGRKTPKGADIVPMAKEKPGKDAWLDTKVWSEVARKLSAEAKNVKEAFPASFTVWSSAGYGNDGCHSANRSPKKEFDSWWASKTEANDRATYLFYWQNPWGVDPREFGDKRLDSTETQEMILLTVTSPELETWTVGVAESASLPLRPAEQSCRDAPT